MARNNERIALWILLGVLLCEGFPVAWWFNDNPARFIAYMGFVPEHDPGMVGWLLAALVTAVYVTYSSRIPSVRRHLFHFSALKVVAVAMAIAAGILEEIVFRRYVMDYVDRQGYGAVLQVLASGITFGAAHAVWGIMGRSLGAALGAAIATFAMGVLLGIVYIASQRSLAACIVAHVLITGLIEPGLVLAALRGEFRRGKATS